MESNSEHWNALLLSLRELTEWVIRKDTELTQLRLGPLRGDAASLQKQLVSLHDYIRKSKGIIDFVVPSPYGRIKFEKKKRHISHVVTRSILWNVLKRP